MKKHIYKTDSALYPAGVLTVITGIGLHVAGHECSHDVWELWAAAHTIVAVVFLIFIVSHIIAHKTWFRSVLTSALRKRRMLTSMLSIVAIPVFISGLSLLAIMGANTTVGIMHYKIGVLFALLMTIHASKRFYILKNKR
ncbi:MAG: DUF4405 domain-containing protein [Prevotella sp.]